MSAFILGDCMDYLPDYPDNYFDLAIVDPPYGGGFTADAMELGHRYGRFGQRFERYFENVAGGGRFDAYAKRQGWKDGRNLGDEVPDERGYL
ncbi:MAG: hypothetical protein IIZ15_02850 [Coriobacteriales bacterium]|nr:hypothetical protein [Coriobacteriales bacterium]